MYRKIYACLFRWGRLTPYIENIWIASPGERSMNTAQVLARLDEIIAGASPRSASHTMAVRERAILLAIGFDARRALVAFYLIEMLRAIWLYFSGHLANKKTK
jgi:hypothetical protein